MGGGSNPVEMVAEIPKDAYETTSVGYQEVENALRKGAKGGEALSRSVGSGLRKVGGEVKDTGKKYRDDPAQALIDTSLATSGVQPIYDVSKSGIDKVGAEVEDTVRKFRDDPGQALIDTVLGVTGIQPIIDVGKDALKPNIPSSPNVAMPETPANRVGVTDVVGGRRKKNRFDLIRAGLASTIRTPGQSGGLLGAGTVATPNAKAKLGQ